jgi:POT family proton-dependent oligopeptide transporter
MLLIAIGLAVTVFRGAYEQIGNTVALWADEGVDRGLSTLTIPMTWFQSLNPLLVILLTPMLLARWRRRAAASREPQSMRKMATGAGIVAAAFALLAAAAFSAQGGRASWLWLVVFLFVFTLGELYILPTGLGLFARLAPPKYGATTVAAWFLAIFTGSLAAGAIGAMWGTMSHGRYFLLLSGIAALAGLILLALDRFTRRIELARAHEALAINASPAEIS